MCYVIPRDKIHKIIKENHRVSQQSHFETQQWAVTLKFILSFKTSAVGKFGQFEGVYL